MAKTETLNLEVKSNIKSVTQDTDKMADSLGDVNKEASEGVGNFTMMGVSLNGVKAAFGKIIPMAKAMFGTIKAGLISTGIGAFAVIIGSLVSFFKNTKEGAESLRRILDGLGAGMNVLTDVVSKLGEGIFNAFNNPKQALIDLWEAIKKNLLNRLTGIIDGFQAVGKVIKGVFEMDWDAVKKGAEDYGKALIQITTGYDTEQQKKFLKGIKDINDQFKSGIMLQMALTAATQKLKDEERKFIKVRAQTRQEIQKSRLEALDETKTAKERLAALKKANDLEIKTTKRAMRMQRERIRVKKEENKLSKSLEEDLDALAALEVEYIDLKTQSFQTQKRLATEMETLTNEMNAKAKADAKVIADEEKAKEESRKLSLLAFQDWKLTRLKDETDAELKIRMAAAKKIGEEEIKAEEAVVKAKKKIRDANLNNISAGLSLVKSLAGENKEIMAGVIIAENALGIARTIISTQASNATAIAEGAALAIPTAGASVIAASGLVTANNIAMGLSIAASIAAAGVGLSALGKGGATGGTAPAGSGGGGGGGTPATEMMSGSFELGSGEEIQPLQAYVLSDDITASQNGLAVIRRRATI